MTALEQKGNPRICNVFEQIRGFISVRNEGLEPSTLSLKEPIWRFYDFSYRSLLFVFTHFLRLAILFNSA